MTWSKDFTSVRLQDNDLVVTGDSRAEDDIKDADVEELSVTIFATDCHDVTLAARATITERNPLVSPWQVTFTDVPAPFNEHNKCLYLTGTGVVRGVAEPFAWTQRKKVLHDRDPKPKPGDDC